MTTIRNIVTDTTDDHMLVDRFIDESKGIEYWSRKQITGRKPLQPAVVRTESAYVRLLDKERNPVYSTYTNMGIVHWECQKNGDTWFAHIMKTGNKIYSFDYYYWNTVGSIGLVYRATAEKDGVMQDFLVLISSHAMLRYRERMHLEDMKPFDLITYLAWELCWYDVSPRITDNRRGLQMAISDGVFRGEVLDEEPYKGHLVIRFKTFISKDMLTPKDRILYNQQMERFYGKRNCNNA